MAPLDSRWAHAVNSRAQLAQTQRAVARGAVTAVEADVIWSARQQRPVMGHPPADDGDVALEQFLDAMLALAAPASASASDPAADSAWAAPLVVKLDFKSAQAFRAASEPMQRFARAFPFRRGLFVNADILRGPVDEGDAVAFDACEFLREASALGRQADGAPCDKVVLSVGWTTRNGSDEERQRPYTREMVDEMLRLLEPHAELPVTFPLRATSVRASWPEVRRLLARSNHSLTLWWALSQMADDELEWLYHTLELGGEGGQQGLANRTFYDILGFEQFIDRRESLAVSSST